MLLKQHPAAVQGAECSAQHAWQAGALCVGLAHARVPCWQNVSLSPKSWQGKRQKKQRGLAAPRGAPGDDVVCQHPQNGLQRRPAKQAAKPRAV